jgi:hypothetical protein
MFRVFIAVLVGLIFGILGPYYLAIGIFSLIPWAFAAAILGYYCGGWAEAALDGAIYGFVLSFSFMIAGYTGNDPVAGRFPAFAILGLFGAACGSVFGLAGLGVRRSMIRRSK